MPLGSRRRKIKEKMRHKSKSLSENEGVKPAMDIELEKPGSDGEWETEYLEEDKEAREFFAGKTVKEKNPQRELRVADIVAEFEQKEVSGEVANQNEPRKAPTEQDRESPRYEVGSNEVTSEKPVERGNDASRTPNDKAEWTLVETSRKRTRRFSEDDLGLVGQDIKDKNVEEEKGTKDIEELEIANEEEVQRNKGPATIERSVGASKGEKSMRSYYQEELASREYMVSLVLKKEATSRMKRRNIIKIYRIIKNKGRFLRGFKMVAFNRAELTFSEMAAANEILRRAEEGDACFNAYLPERKKTRKGVIIDWEEPVDALDEALVPGQPEAKFERLKKKVTKDGKTEWVEGIAILATFKGDQLPKELWIGHGHVSVRVFPFVEAVKQCYRCFAFGHIQSQCRNKYKRCIRCLENEHGQCDRPAKCLNCGGDHTSLSKGCWQFQREKAVKKVMAYRNVAYATARDLVSKQMGDNGILDDDDDRVDGSRDYPALSRRNRIKSPEFWEKGEVPLGEELQAIREARGQLVQIEPNPRGWETALGIRKDPLPPSKGRGRGRLNLVIDDDPIKTREGLVRKKMIEMEKRKWDNRYEVLQPESDPEDVEPEYTFGYGELEEAAIKRVSKMEQRANRNLIEQLRKRREEEFLTELLSLIADRGFEKEVEQHLRKKKYGKKQTEEEEYREWNTPQRPPWNVPIPAKTQAKIDRKKALYAAREEEKKKQLEEWENSLPGPSHARREREREQIEAEREEERCRQRLREMKKGPLGWVFRQNDGDEPSEEV
ncbi:uncharacterized protein LOC117609874 [Osmia lignaria lignaria]|uniref:uncharacterized protein LOC117609874 n=1 Tax=Osmia lignaria lignaria TaxID=1437193 RepID=UPI00402BF00E